MRAGTAYPYDRWPRATRAEARSASLLARALIGLDASALESARAVLGAPISLARVGSRLAAIDALSRELGAAAALIGALEPHRFVIALAPGIARVIADRATGGDGTDVALGPTPLTRGELGIVGYVVARVMQQTRSGSVLVDAASTAEALGALPGPRVAIWSATLAIGQASGPAWLVAPLDACEALPAPRPAIDPSLRVRASIVIGLAGLPATTVAALRPGDTIVPDALDFDPRTGAGHARLVVARSSRVYEIVLAQDAWRVAHGGGLPSPRAPRSWPRRRKDSMSDTQEGLSDVEVELSIELARLDMPVAEVAALAPGVVVTTGRLVGERVAVRAGEQVIAWGELIDVEGEVGVRLTEVAARG